MDYSEINKEAVDMSLDRLWFFASGVWTFSGQNIIKGNQFLHVASEEKPNWNPELLTLTQVKNELKNLQNNDLAFLLKSDVWWLSRDGWVRVDNINGCTDYFVYLISQGMPTYHPTQQKIAKIILGESKMTQKPEPHIHANLIKAWADDINQSVWVWSAVVSDWLPTVPSWDVKCFYAIGEKPTSPPTIKATVKISLDATELTIELPIGSRKEEIEKAILDKAVQFINYDYEFDK